MRIALLAAAFGCMLAIPAEWLSRGGDPQRTGWQRREKHLNAGTVKGLTLLWKKQLADGSNGASGLTAPVMLGNIITHRGIKELVFIADASDNFYAVDADLGRIFWKRHFDTAATSTPRCASGPPAAPAITYAHTNEDDDWSTPLRPIYILASDGTLHTIRPSDGEDMAPPVKLLPPNANAGDLNLAGNLLYTTTSARCEGAREGVWAIKVGGPDASPAFFPASPKPGVAVGLDGTVYSSSGEAILALTPEQLKLKNRFELGDSVNAPPLIFHWQAREFLAAAGKHQLHVIDTQQKTHTTRNAAELTGALATWEGASGKPWIYAGTSRGIQAFNAELLPLWNSDGRPALSLVVANGILYALEQDQLQTTLHAVDATTGKQLYSSDDLRASPILSSSLAVANGHVCFGTATGTLYCFGLPMEI